MQFAVNSHPLGPYIFLSTLLSNTLSLSSFLNLRDQVSDPYKTIGKIAVLYVLLFIFVERKLEVGRYRTM
jgi:hypothetical protein